jgi:transcriptional regulator with XRE-family HTH domain
MMPKVENQPIPNCLRKYRRARGLKQKEVAQILGLKNSSMISRWERGVCLPSALNVFRLASLYATPVEALFADLLEVLRRRLGRREEKIFNGGGQKG